MISTDAKLPQSDDIRQLKTRLYEMHREIAIEINKMLEKLSELEARIEALEP